MLRHAAFNIVSLLLPRRPGLVPVDRDDEGGAHEGEDEGEDETGGYEDDADREECGDEEGGDGDEDR